MLYQVNNFFFNEVVWWCLVDSKIHSNRQQALITVFDGLHYNHAILVMIL